jgi:hypothetical protein
MRYDVIRWISALVLACAFVPSAFAVTQTGACGNRLIAPGASLYLVGNSDDGTRIDAANATGPALGWAAASLPVTLPSMSSILSHPWTVCGASENNKALVFNAPLLAAPSAPVLSSTTGGTIGSTTYYVKATYVNSAGETVASSESSLAVGANNLLVVTSPTSSGNAIGWNVYVGTVSGSETKHNNAPLTLGVNWTEPLGGLVSGAALPITGNAPSAYILDGGAILRIYLVGTGNYQTVTLSSDGSNYRVVSASTESRLFNGSATSMPARVSYPGGPGDQAAQGDNGFILSSGAASGGLAVTLPATADIAAGWTARFTRDAGNAMTVQGGTIAFPGGTAISLSLAPYDSEFLERQFDGAVFRMAAVSPATAAMIDMSTAPLHVPSNAALKTLKGKPGSRVLRDGALTAGDGSGAPYDWSGSNCSAADDGAQVQPTGITGCWVADFSGAPPTPMIWGARGDGTTDDTAAVQAAITAMAGGTLYTGRHRYCIGSPGLVSYHPIAIVGDTPSAASETAQYGFVSCTPNIAILKFGNDGTHAANGSRVENVFFDAAAAGANTSGAAVVLNNVSWVVADHVRIKKACIGVDEQIGNSNKVASSLITSEGADLASGCGGIRVGHSSTNLTETDFRVVDTAIDVRADYSMMLEDAGGVFLRGDDFLFSLNGLVIKPGANQRVQWLFAENSALSDTTCSDGLVVDTTAPSAVISGLSFVQTWTASAGNNPGTCSGVGVRLSNNGGGTVKGIRFIGHRAYSNGAQGFNIEAGVHDVTIEGSDICANSTITANVPATVYDGITIGPNASGIAIRTSRIGARCVYAGAFEGLQGTGIFLLGGNTDISITDNDLRGNASSGLAYSGSSPAGAIVIKNNTGVDDRIGNVADAAVITPPLSSLITITGTGTTISTINGMWDGREIKLYMRDGNITLSTGGNLCNGGTFAQFTSATITRFPGASCSTVK